MRNAVVFIGAVTYLNAINDKLVSLTLANKVEDNGHQVAAYVPMIARAGNAEKLVELKVKPGDVLRVEGTLTNQRDETVVFIRKVEIVNGEHEFCTDMKGQSVLLKGVNEVTFGGRLGRNPEINETKDQTPVANFSLAYNESFKDREGNTKKAVVWMDVSAFGEASQLPEGAVKGKQVQVNGKITMKSRGDKLLLALKAEQVSAPAN